MRHLIVSIAVCTALLLTPLTAGASNDTLRIATWNIAWLAEPADAHSSHPRTDADIDRLAAYAAQLDADIVALQEIRDVGVAERVFGPGYDIYLSSRNDTQKSGYAVRRSVTINGAPLEVTSIGLPGAHLRYGMDLSVSLSNGMTLRILAVHLKSGCWAKALDSNSRACKRLADQLGPLEAWIDARARAQDPFVVLGDFNRRFDIEDESADGSDLWSVLSDEDPPGQKLMRVTEDLTSRCWNSQYPKYIDHIVFGPQAKDWIVSGTFNQIVYTDPVSERALISDHCPISVDIKPS